MLTEPVKSYLPMVAIVLGSFALYTLTAAPMITAGDAGELVSAAFTLGIAHPPGYPLSSLTGRLASFMPIGDVAFRMNVLAGVFMSLSALAGYLVMNAMSGERKAVHAGFALAAAFCSECWGLAVAAEVYPLQLLLSLLAIYMLVRWRKGAGISFLYAGFFLAGLSVVAHYTAIVFLPAFALAFALGIGKDDRIRAGAVSAAFFLAGLSVFLYLPVRASAGPPINWGDTGRFRSFLDHVSRAAYGDLGAFRFIAEGQGVTGGSALAGSGSMAVAAVAVLAVVMLVLLKKSIGKSFRFLPMVVGAVTVMYLLKLGLKGVDIRKMEFLVRLAADEYWGAVVPFAAYGLYRQYVRDRDMFYVNALLLSCLTVVMVFRVRMDPNDYALPFAAKFFAPWFAVTAVIGGVGAGEASTAVREGRKAAVSAVLAASALVFAAALAVQNYKYEDSSRLYWPHDYSVDMMRTFNDSSIFLAGGDHHPFLGIYQKTVEMARPDVTFLDPKGNVFKSYDEMSEIYEGPSQTVYCSQDPELDYFPGIEVRQAGVLNWWDEGGRPAPDPVPYYTFRASPEDAVKAGYMDRSLYANFNYHLATRLISMGEDGLAEGYLRKTLKAGGDFVWVRVNAGNIYRSWGSPSRAVEEYLEALKLAPASSITYKNLGNVYIDTGRYGLARQAFGDAARYAPNDPEPRLRLEDIKRLERADFH